MSVVVYAYCVQYRYIQIELYFDMLNWEVLNTIFSCLHNLMYEAHSYVYFFFKFNRRFNM